MFLVARQDNDYFFEGLPSFVATYVSALIPPNSRVTVLLMAYWFCALVGTKLSQLMSSLGQSGRIRFISSNSYSPRLLPVPRSDHRLWGRNPQARLVRRCYVPWRGNYRDLRVSQMKMILSLVKNPHACSRMDLQVRVCSWQLLTLAVPSRMLMIGFDDPH